VSDLQRPDTAPAPREERRTPLSLLPAEWQDPVKFFYASYSDILKGTLGVVTSLRLWIKDDALTLDEAKPILKRLMSPEERMSIVYPGQLLAKLAGLVSEVVNRRRQLDAMLERRRKAEVEKANAAPPGYLKAALEGLRSANE
jgi:hypothetical protein